MTWRQTAAVMEVIHSALGVVRSPLVTTVLQVSPRARTAHTRLLVLGAWPANATKKRITRIRVNRVLLLSLLSPRPPSTRASLAS